jgi:hypothetical protein
VKKYELSQKWEADESPFFRRENSPRFARVFGGRMFRREMRIALYSQGRTG